MAGTPKFTTDSKTASAPPASTAGRMSGRVTVSVVLAVLAPSIPAASSRAVSILSRAVQAAKKM